MREGGGIEARRIARRRAAPWGGMLAIVAAGFAAGCAPAAPPPPVHDTLDAWRAYADGIEAHAKAYRTVRGTWSEGGTTSDLTAFYRDGTLHFVSETMDLGEWGRRSLRYVYAGSVLRYVGERATVRLAGANGGVDMAPLERQMLFDEEGHLVDSAQRLRGEAGRVDPAAASGVREHAGALRDAVPPPGSGG